MSFIWAIVSGQWKAVLVGLLIAGLSTTSFVFEKMLNHTRQKLQESKDSYIVLQISYDNYKKLVAEAAELEKQRAKTAQEALKQAMVASGIKIKEASTVASLRAPQGVSDCRAAEDLLNESL